MASLASSVPPWIPEDDLLLKNAVEAGASLEALAKGAVRFSRKFTVGELRDRWYSLLYDPVISAEASARMAEFELAVPDPRVNADVSAKRKLETVRRMYYAMRKKTCSRPGSSPSISFLGAPEASCRDNMAFDSQPQGGSCMFGDRNQNHFGFVGKDNAVQFPSFEKVNGGKSIPSNVRDGLVDFPVCEGVQEVALAYPLSESSFHEEGISSPLALWETIEDISPPAMPVSVSIEDKVKQEALMRPDGMELDGDKVSISGTKVVHSGAILQDRQDVDVLNNSNAIPECDYADLSETLLNFANEDEVLLLDPDGKDAIDKFCYDGALVNLPNEVHGRAPNVKESKIIVSDKNLETPPSACPAELDPDVERSLSSGTGQHGHLCSEINLSPSTSTAHTFAAEQCDGEMECVLNSEDPDIPSNDDVLFPKETSSSIMRTQSKEVGYSCFPYDNRNDDKQQTSLTKKEANPAQSRIASQIRRLDLLPATSQGNQLSCRVKCESSDDAASRQPTNAHGCTNQCRRAQATQIPGPDGLIKAEALHACNALGLPLYTKTCSPEQVTSVPEAKPITLDEEESEIDDDDIPSYSDIEAMILDMDLCPDDTDYYSNREVSRYQNVDTRRVIIRLEQCAQSSIQRAIASRGAFAVFYGRHLKHYIRETEVILGRATNDMEVDIDLGREGPANKISRRQALIKMEADGSFLMKNLGKSLVFLNGKEVASGQSMSLGSNSLIEIGGMAFVFEMNSKSVGRHLAKATNIPQQNNIKFEWSEGIS